MAANFEHYKIFYYVARYGSFTKAAELLYSNQPNITRIIRILETELDCKLMPALKPGNYFDRRRRTALPESGGGLRTD